MTLLSVVPARLEYACGHAGLVSLPLVKGESRRQRSERVEAEKAAARLRSCDFCAPSVSPAIASDVVAAATSGPAASPAVSLDQGRTGTMVNDADGHPPMGQQDSMTPVPTVGSTADQGLSGRTEPIPEPAAQQPTRTRSGRAMHRLKADSEQAAARLERTAEPERAARRRLSPEQAREVARLYAEGALPTSEIRKRFGIGESSLYRIVQREGVPLRGRAAATPQPAPPRAQAPDSGRRGSSTASGTPAPAVQPPVAAPAAPTRPSTRGGRGPAARRATPAASGAASAPRAAGRRQFRVHFRGERVIQARDIREALRQAESLGAIEVTAVTRAD
jgi:transposase-like protein